MGGYGYETAQAVVDSQGIWGRSRGWRWLPGLIGVNQGYLGLIVDQLGIFGRSHSG